MNRRNQNKAVRRFKIMEEYQQDDDLYDSKAYLSSMTQSVTQTSASNGNLAVLQVEEEEANTTSKKPETNDDSKEWYNTFVTDAWTAIQNSDKTCNQAWAVVGNSVEAIGKAITLDDSRIKHRANELKAGNSINRPYHSNLNIPDTPQSTSNQMFSDLPGVPLEPSSAAILSVTDNPSVSVAHNTQETQSGGLPTCARSPSEGDLGTPTVRYMEPTGRREDPPGESSHGFNDDATVAPERTSLPASSPASSPTHKRHRQKSIVRYDLDDKHTASKKWDLTMLPEEFIPDCTVRAPPRPLRPCDIPRGSEARQKKEISWVAMPEHFFTNAIRQVGL